MADFKQLSEGKYALGGDVSLSDIAQLLRFPSIDGAASPVELDLSPIKSADSAVAALLLDWHRQLADQGRTLNIVNTPDSVSLLLGLYDLESVLNV